MKLTPHSGSYVVECKRCKLLVFADKFRDTVVVHTHRCEPQEG